MRGGKGEGCMRWEGRGVYERWEGRGVYEVGRERGV